MNDPGPMQEIQAALSRLDARARGLALARGLAGAVAGLCAGLLLASVLASAGAPALVASLLGWISLAGLAALALVLWAVPAWRRRGDLLHQARTVEGIRPELEERLTTVVGRALVGARPAGASPALLARAARTAYGTLAALPPEEVYPSRSLRPVSAAAAGAVLLTLLAAWWMPVGPVEALAVGLRGPADGAAVAPAVDPSVRAVVGDIVLRYIFPAHTGNPPVEVRNSDGGIHAPVGTVVEIRARTLDRYDDAVLEIDGATAEPASLVAGRDVSASLTVAAEGTWRFAFTLGDAVVLSPDYRIEVDEDAAPVVALERPPGRTPSADAPLGVSYAIQDDFGITKVVLEIEDEAGNVREVVLREPLDAPRELQGTLRMSPRELGLPVGQRSKLRVVATDNDVGAGNKRGASATLEVVPLGPKGQGARLEAHFRRLRDALVLALADFLVDPSPPAGEAVGMVRWAEVAQRRLDAVVALQRAQWGDEPSDSLDGPLLTKVFDDSGRLFRFVITTWEPGSGRRVTEGDIAELQALQAELVLSLEQAVYLIDSALRGVAMQQLIEKAEDVAAEAKALAAAADTSEVSELLARLDKLDRLLQELSKAADSLSDADLKEFVNSRTNESAQLMEQIRAALEEGRVEEARELMKQLAEQLQQMAESLGDRMASGQQDAGELKEALQKTMDELEALENDQRALADELNRSREELGEDVQDQLDAWKKVEEALRALQGSSGALLAALGDGRGWRVDTLRRVERAVELAGAIEGPVRGRDPEAALDSVFSASPLMQAARRLIAAEGQRQRAPGEATPPMRAQAGAAADQSAGHLETLRSLLEPLVRRGQTDAPEVQEAARRLSAQQSELERRQQTLEKELQRVERALPTGQGKATAEMQAAGEAMERAEGALESGEAMQAEGNQVAAADHIRNARERLSEAMQQQQQQQQAQAEMQGQRQEEDGEGGKGDGESAVGRQQLVIPPPEDFRTPEAYRRALLEGMSGDVPEEYEALKRRYFEELVHQ